MVCFQHSVAVFFFQAEDGIRDLYVTGVQTCALPISREVKASDIQAPSDVEIVNPELYICTLDSNKGRLRMELTRSEERRVGKECSARRTSYDRKKFLTKAISCTST